MTPKLFTGLAITAVASLVLAAVVHNSSDTWDPGVAEGEKLFPELAANAERAKSITLRHNKDTLALERQGDTWTVKSADSYPAKAEKVRALLLQLNNAELVAQKTQNPERFALLELEDFFAKDAKSRMVSVNDENGKAIAEVIVGKSSAEQFAAGKGGTYVRRPGEKSTWLVNTKIDVPTNVSSWVDTVVAQVDTANLQSIRVDLGGGQTFAIEPVAGKPGGRKAYKLVDMPKDHKLKSDYVLSDVVNAFARIELDDVRKAGDRPVDASRQQQAVFNAKDGLVVTLTVRTEGQGDDTERWATLGAVVAPQQTASPSKPAPPGGDEPGDAAARSDEGETASRDAADVNTAAAKPDAAKPKSPSPQDRADKINASAKGWEFKLSNWKYDQIFKKREDLLKAASG